MPETEQLVNTTWLAGITGVTLEWVRSREEQAQADAALIERGTVTAAEMREQ